jgi:hypothetical protein
MTMTGEDVKVIACIGDRFVATKATKVAFSSAWHCRRDLRVCLMVKYADFIYPFHE